MDRSPPSPLTGPQTATFSSPRPDRPRSRPVRAASVSDSPANNADQSVLDWPSRRSARTGT